MKKNLILTILFVVAFILSNIINVSASSTAAIDTAEKLLENYPAETDDTCVSSRISTSSDDAEE